MKVKTKFSRNKGGRIIPLNNLLPFASGGLINAAPQYKETKLKKPALIPIDDQVNMNISAAAREQAEQDRWTSLPPGIFELQGLNPEQIKQEVAGLEGFNPMSEDPTEVNNYANLLQRFSQQFRSGGGIHIKPENRGKFTAYKKRTGKTTEEALHSKDPHVRQMANFARNAKKWKKGCGGKIKMKE